MRRTNLFRSWEHFHRKPEKRQKKNKNSDDEEDAARRSEARGQSCTNGREGQHRNVAGESGLLKVVKKSLLTTQRCFSQ